MPGQAHLRVRVNGQLGGFDIFSWGFALKNGDFLTPAQSDDLAAAVVAYMSLNATGISGMATLSEMAVSRVDATHKQIGDTLRVPLVGGGSVNTAIHPPQIACRVSLSDGLRGRSHRGGYYLPAPGRTINLALGTMSKSDADATLGASLDFIRAVNTIAGGSGAFCIASKILGNLTVTQVRVGRALDTIRSRRNALNEEYSAGAV